MWSSTGFGLWPTLWNIFYDGLLRVRLPDGVSIVGFADDVVLVSVSHTTEGIEKSLNKGIPKVEKWIREHGFELACQKTEAVVLSKKWAYRELVLYSGGVKVPVMRAVRYLGVTLVSKLSFTRHIRAASALTTAAAKAIGRLMPNVGGPSVTKRRLLATVVSSRLLYAEPVWASNVARFKINVVELGKAQRQAVLRITQCYWTVSTAAVLLLAEIPPADLLAIERETPRKRRRDHPDMNVNAINEEVRAVTLAQWQKRWSEETGVAEWTRRLLLSIRRWIERPSGAPVTYRLAQGLQ